MGMIRILNGTGDTAVEWDVANKQATEVAEAKFNELVREGNTLVETKNGVGEETTVKFDPKAEEYVAIRQIGGG